MLLAAVLGAAPLGAQTGLLRGRVSDAESDRAIASARVELRGEAGALVSLTDTAGRYLLRELAPAAYELRVHAVGHDEVRLSVTLGAGREVTVDVPLQPRPAPGTRPLPLARVVVRAKVQVVASPPTGTEAPSSPGPSDGAPWRALRGAGPGAVGTLRDLGAFGAPGTRDPAGVGLSRPAHRLVIAGTGEELGRVRLDGVPLEVPLQVAGLLPRTDGALVVRGDVRAAGASPRYDGGAAYMLDLGTRAGARDRHRTWGAVDPLVSRLGLEGPVGAAGVVVGLRRANPAWTERLLGQTLGYGYEEGIGRADWRVGGASALQATVVASAEHVSLPRDLEGRDRAAWRNTAGGVVWSRRDPGRSDAPGLLVRATLGRGAVSLPLLSARAGRLRTTTERATFAAERLSAHRTPAGRASLLVGGDLELLGMREVASGITAAGGASDSAAGADACRAGACWRATAVRVAAFGEWAGELGPRTRLTAGGRVFAGSTGGGGALQVRALPRVALQLAASRALLVGVSAGRFSQFAVPREPPASTAGPAGGAPVSGGPPAGAPGGPRPSPTLPTTAPQRGIRHPVEGTQVELGAAARRPHTLATAVLSVTSLSARAHAAAVSPALDVAWQWNRGPAAVALAYSAGRMRGAARQSGARGRQLLTGTVSGARGALGLELAATWATGLTPTSVVLDHPEAVPTTTPPVPGDSGATWLPTASMARVDLTARRVWRVPRAGPGSTVGAYVTLRNALGRADALLHYTPAAAGAPRALAALPRVLTLGVQWDVGRTRRRHAPSPDESITSTTP